MLHMLLFGYTQCFSNVRQLLASSLCYVVKSNVCIHFISATQYVVRGRRNFSNLLQLQTFEQNRE